MQASGNLEMAGGTLSITYGAEVTGLLGEFAAVVGDHPVSFVSRLQGGELVHRTDGLLPVPLLLVNPDQPLETLSPV